MGSVGERSLSIDMSKYPKVSREQAGHLRHFHNLASQLDGSWHHMGSQEPLQEFLDAYRYQLATMTYAAAVAHYHHQPILRSVYKPLIRRLIHKMLCREVWAYWFNTSLGGIRTDPDLKELRKPWADPVVRENIMYSGHLLLMVSLYAMLFDDDEFEKEGALTFEWDPLFYGLGPEKFSYNTASLQKAILAEMESNGWVGVCCEPNVVFVVCNQFPIIAMRYNDVRDGTHTVDNVLTKYKAAWESKGNMVGPGSLFPDAWMVKQDWKAPAKEPAFTAWACAFMNSWNSEFVRGLYDQQSAGYLTTINGETRLHPPAVGNAFRELMEKDDAPSDSAETLEKAKNVAKGAPKSNFPFTKPMFGYIVQWLSELGKTSELNSLLQYADDRLNPTWENGGLYYPRHDEPFNDDLQWTHIDPFTGNAAIGYARLNVEDGQKKMWERPWTAEMLKERPYVDGVSLGDGVDFLRACWDEGERCVVLTVRSWDGRKKAIRPSFKNLPAGLWMVYVDGEQKAAQHVNQGREVDVQVEVGDAEVDVVVMCTNA